MLNIRIFLSGCHSAAKAFPVSSCWEVPLSLAAHTEREAEALSRLVDAMRAKE